MSSTRVTVVISGQLFCLAVSLNLIFPRVFKKKKKAHGSVTESAAVIPLLTNHVTSEHTTSRVPHLRDAPPCSFSEVLREPSLFCH